MLVICTLIFSCSPCVVCLPVDPPLPSMQAREFLGNSQASVTFMQVPPVGYLRVHRDDDAGEGGEGGNELEQGSGSSASGVVNMV